MKAIHIKRLEKLAAHLEKGKLGHKKFKFYVWNGDKDGLQLETNGCGFCGCAIGESPFVFPSQWKFKDGYPVLKTTKRWGWGEIWGGIWRDPSFDDGMEFFGLGERQMQHLFSPYGQNTREFGGQKLGLNASPKMVARNIRAFIKIKKQEAK